MIRSATLSDAPRLRELCNEHERRVDPHAEDMSLEEIELKLRGEFEPGENFVHLGSEGQIDAVSFIAPDTARARCVIDFYSLTDADSLNEIAKASLAWVGKNAPNFELRTYCNKDDQTLMGLFETFKFELFRNYWKLARKLSLDSFPQLPEGVNIRKVSWPGEAQLIYDLEKSSFREHFGYVELAFEDWLEQFERDELMDPAGFFVLEHNGLPVGFSLASDLRAEQNGGWVDKLGVVDQSRGKGFGKLLLEWQFAYSASRGFDSIALGVDSGNESGALNLYFGLGFEVSVVWAAFRLPKKD